MQMRNSLVLAAVAFFAPALAQAASPQAEKNMSMGLAQEIVAGVIEECAKSSYKVSVVVVDRAGQVAASLRGDGTSPATVEFARMKAYTARVRNQTSLEFMAFTASGDAQALRQIPGVVAIGGGVPIKAGAETIGGVGVSGAPGGEKDEACAKAALGRVSASLN
jgi:uncharacterized protein GlcG (DUF336 family)